MIRDETLEQARFSFSRKRIKRIRYREPRDRQGARFYTDLWRARALAHVYNRVAKELYGAQGPAIRRSNFYRSKVRFRSWVRVPICGPSVPSPSPPRQCSRITVQSAPLSRCFSSTVPRIYDSLGEILFPGDTRPRGHFRGGTIRDVAYL